MRSCRFNGRMKALGYQYWTQEEIEQLRKKYGVSDFNDSSMAREFLRRQEEQN